MPIIALVGQGVAVRRRGHGRPPGVAPALVIVGYLMIRIVADIDWARPEDAIPAFLIIAGIPLTFSIAAGIGLGVLGYVLVMVAQRPRGDVHPLMWLVAPVRRVLRRGLAERERVLTAGALAQTASGTIRARVHVDQPAVGELELRDDREREEARAS